MSVKNYDTFAMTSQSMPFYAIFKNYAANDPFLLWFSAQYRARSWTNSILKVHGNGHLQRMDEHFKKYNYVIHRVLSLIIFNIYLN